MLCTTYSWRSLRGPAGWIGRLAATLVVGTVLLSGQAPDASVRGVVSSAQGKPLAGVTLVATHSGTGLVQTTTSDSEGRYYFGSLPRGLYSLTVQMAGYQGLEKRGIELAVGARHGLGTCMGNLAALE